MAGPHHTTWAKGRIVQLAHRSRILAGNPWNDPLERQVSVYLPAESETDQQHYPVLWHLAAYTKSGAGLGNWRNFGENLPQRLDRLIATGQMGPVVVVAPDCFTALGGNQYLNTTGLGRYEDYIHDELIPFTERELPIRPGGDQRAVFGKSSGGYGALQFGMSRPNEWAALANHSGDTQFEVVYRQDFPTMASTLARFDGDPQGFLEHFWQAEQVSGAEVHTLMLLCMAASYDPDPASPASIRLPFDLDTLEMDPDRWQNWLRFDPINQLESGCQALKRLKGIYMDCGNRDQYHIQYGSRILSREMTRLGIAHHYEEFDGNHSGIDHRLDISLPYLYRKITQDETT
jgi:enterochelin esterase-like enzyme